MIIRAKNFLSWENLEFEVAKGVTLIQGFNHDDNTPEGSGKSAILNALAWGLFGKIPKDANVDDVIREGASKCEVEIELDGFSIYRSRKPNDLCIIQNNKEVRGKDARETQVQIEKLIGMSFDSFCQSIYFAQNYPNKFVTANQENKGKILSEILDLEQFDRARKAANDKLKLVNEELIGINKDVERYATLKRAEQDNQQSFKDLISQFEEEKVKKIKGLFKSLEANNQEAENFVAEFEASKEKELKKIKSDIKSTESDIQEKESEEFKLREVLGELDAESIEQELQDLQKRIEGNEEARNGIKVKLGSIDMIIREQEKAQKELKNSKKELETVSNKIKSMELNIEGALSDLDHDKEVLEEAIAALKNPEKSNCPTCGQEWSGDISHYEKEVDKAKKEKSRTESMLKGYEKDLAELKEQRIALKQNIKDLEKEVSEQEFPSKESFTKKLDTIESVLVGYKDLKKELENKLRAIDRISSDLKNISNQVTMLNKQKEKLEKEYEAVHANKPDKFVEKFLKRAEELESEIEAEDAKEPTSLKEKLSASKEKIKKLTSELQKVEAIQIEKNKLVIQLEALKDGYKEVKAYAFQNVLNQLTRKANNYLGELFEQPVKIKFENVDMKIDVSVSIEGKERPLGLYSGGQFRRIALAVDLALSDITCSRNSNKLNLMILDEYCKDLSEVSMEKVLKLLQARKGSTILIEHNSIFKSIVNNVFEVELINKVSRRVQ